MKESYLLDMSFNNIIFKGRNKTYGAYNLRRTYADTLKNATLIAIAVFSGLIVMPMLTGSPTEKEIVVENNKGITVFLDPPVMPDLPVIEPKNAAAQAALPAKKKIKTVAFAPPKVVSNSTKVTAVVPSQAELENVVIGNQNTDGTEGGNNTTAEATGSEEVEGGTGTDASAIAPFDYVEDMPSFIGGESAMIQFLSKNMRYPTKAQNAEVEGIVVVSFVVAANGDIMNAQVLKGLGFGTDEEALRVINKMPKWKPGKQNGRNVPVRFTIPIRFNMKR